MKTRLSILGLSLGAAVLLSGCAAGRAPEVDTRPLAARIGAAQAAAVKAMGTAERMGRGIDAAASDSARIDAKTVVLLENLE